MDKRIGFTERLGAVIIDYVLLLLIGGPLSLLVGGLLGAAALSQAAAVTGDSPGQAAAAGGLIGAIGGIMLGLPIAGALYFLLEAMWGWTPGKLMLGLRIGTADGAQAPRSVLLQRYAVKHVHFLLAALGTLTGVALFGTLGALLGFVVFAGCFLALAASRQALHDRAAKTAVFRKEDLAMPAALAW